MEIQYFEGYILWQSFPGFLDSDSVLVVGLVLTVHQVHI